MVLILAHWGNFFHGPFESLFNFSSFNKKNEHSRSRFFFLVHQKGSLRSHTRALSPGPKKLAHWGNFFHGPFESLLNFSSFNKKNERSSSRFFSWCVLSLRSARIRELSRLVLKNLPIGATFFTDRSNPSSTFLP